MTLVDVEPAGGTFGIDACVDGTAQVPKAASRIGRCAPDIDGLFSVLLFIAVRTLPSLTADLGIGAVFPDIARLAYSPR